jgi:general L-amino acid transport system permease protein
MATTSHSDLPSGYLPPPDPPGATKWLRDNLFKGWLNILLTLISAAILYFGVFHFIRWVFIDANWTPVVNFPILYAIGQYPRAEMWRVGLSLALIMFLLGASWRHWGDMLRPVVVFVSALFAVIAVLPIQHDQLTLGLRGFLIALPILMGLAYVLAGWKGLTRRVTIILWLLSPVIVLVLLRGIVGFSLLPEISTTLWGGLLVTFLLSVGGILLSFPIGVALALGRRSSLPVVSAVCTFFIETIRGVPLITLLFMFSVIMALFLPAEARIDRLVRALMAMTIFSAAYTAENVRGGLQSIPPGQIEAAKALGMNGIQTMSLIVLPQALRAVIPTIVGQFITLFKDTTLVVIVSINDLLGIGRSIVNSSPAFLQVQLEVYLFIAAVYWVFSYFMSQASRRLESMLGVGRR